ACLTLRGWGCRGGPQGGRRWAGLGAATPRGATTPRMAGHRCGALLAAGDAPALGPLRFGQRGFCPSLWFLGHTHWLGLPPALSLGKPFSFTRPYREFWVMTSGLVQSYQSVNLSKYFFIRVVP